MQKIEIPKGETVTKYFKNIIKNDIEVKYDIINYYKEKIKRHMKIIFHCDKNRLVIIFGYELNHKYKTKGKNVRGRMIALSYKEEIAELTNNYDIFFINAMYELSIELPERSLIFLETKE